MTAQTKDVIVRTSRTFIQAFLSAWGLAGFTLEKSVIIGAGASALAIVMGITVPAYKAPANGKES